MLFVKQNVAPFSGKTLLRERPVSRLFLWDLSDCQQRKNG